MDSEELSMICRACLKELNNNNKYGLLDIRHLQKMFYACTSMEIVEEDSCSKFLCEMCYKLIKKFYEFRTMCALSYNTLQSLCIVHDEDKTNNTILTNDGELFEEYLSDDDNTDDVKEELTYLQIDQDFSEDLDYYSGLNEDDIIDERIEESDDNASNLSESQEDSCDNNQETISNIGRKKLKCEFCPKKFFLKSRLQAHIRIHEGLKPYVCHECDAQYNDKRSLITHQEVVHMNMLYYCSTPGCDKAFRAKRTLEDHNRKVHSDFKNYQARTQNTSVVCEECGKILGNRQSLKVHLASHSKNFVFKCEKCPKKFNTKTKLKLHCLRHDGVKNFICPHCGMRKLNRKELNVHINCHTKEKVHKCPQCTSTLITRSALNRHIKVVHQGLKDHPCSYCNKSFSTQRILQHHSMTHTGEKPHECTYCGKRFIQLIALQRHLERATHCKQNE